MYSERRMGFPGNPTEVIINILHKYDKNTMLKKEKDCTFGQNMGKWTFVVLTFLKIKTLFIGHLVHLSRNYEIMNIFLYTYC